METTLDNEIQIIKNKIDTLISLQTISLMQSFGADISLEQKAQIESLSDINASSILIK